MPPDLAPRSEYHQSTKLQTPECTKPFCEIVLACEFGLLQEDARREALGGTGGGQSKSALLIYASSMDVSFLPL